MCTVPKTKFWCAVRTATGPPHKVSELLFKNTENKRGAFEQTFRARVSDESIKSKSSYTIACDHGRWRKLERKMDDSRPQSFSRRSFLDECRPVSFPSQCAV